MADTDLPNAGAARVSLTPHRDAVAAAAIEARRRAGDTLQHDSVDAITERMSIEACEAVHGGAADLMDRAVDERLIWPAVASSLARAIAGFLMTASRGDPGLAASLLPGAMASVHELALARLRADPETFSVGVAADFRPSGRA